VESFEWETAVVVPGHAGKGGQSRFRAIGWLGDELVTLVFSPLGSEAIAVISLRPASRAERKQHGKTDKT
jgi:uncharacterized DUF497 family protein